MKFGVLGTGVIATSQRGYLNGALPNKPVEGLTC